MQKSEYERFFPFPTIRPEQEQAIEFTFDEIDKGKRFIILEMGTGGGKSPVAVCISRALQVLRASGNMDRTYKPGSWCLTTQKILQNQYIKDFGPPRGDMASIKSSFNYRCDFFEKNTCRESLQLIREADKESEFFKACMFGCNYRKAKREFLRSALSVTNFSYFLTITAANRQGEVQASKHVVPRDLLIIDECHTIEDELSKHIEVTVKERFAQRTLKIVMPNDLSTQFKAHKWIIDKYRPTLVDKMDGLSMMINKLTRESGEQDEEIKRLTTDLEKLKQHHDKIQQFLKLYDKDNWVFNYEEAYGKSGKVLEFKPIDVGMYAEEYLFRFGRRVLMMSATVLNKEAFCESIGIDPDQASFISIESPFPRENRPVVYIPVGKMTKDDIDRTIPKLTSTVKSLLDDHADEKGIIHSRTFRIARHLMENIDSDRLITHDSSNREEVIAEFMRSDRPLVLVSPSSTEGLDLKGDLSRFQIICKVYWPYLGDKLVKKRMNKHKRWYGYQAAKAAVQATGRSIRTKDDYAVTYILDESWERFYYSNEDLFPDYFKKALMMP